MVIALKAFISVDLEGMPHIVSSSHLSLGGSLYNEARKIATKITLITADELHKRGFEEILIADSHGPMINLLVEDLPEYAELIRGSPRPLSMVSWIEECDVALFLGYHAKAGTMKSTFDHTYSGASIFKVELNGVEASEFLLNSWVAGYHDIPVILVAGEEKLLEEDVKKYAPWAERVILKRSASRYAARSPSMKMIEKMLRESVNNAVTKFRNREVKPLKIDEPVELKITFMRSSFADAASLLPRLDRLDGRTVKYEAKNIIEAYKVFQLLALVSSAISQIAQRR